MVDRYVKQIKICLNKLVGNKNSVNKAVAETIASFSHGSSFRRGDLLQSKRLTFFTISEMLSSHWCLGFFCNPYIVSTLGREIYYAPDYNRRTWTVRKKVFEPFSDSPFVKVRDQIFHLKFTQKQKEKNGAIQAI